MTYINIKNARALEKTDQTYVLLWWLRLRVVSSSVFDTCPDLDEALNVAEPKGLSLDQV